MQTMNRADVIDLSSARERGRRMRQATDARRRLTEPRRTSRPAGRAWLNGSELGEHRAALEHLGEIYD